MVAAGAEITVTTIVLDDTPPQLFVYHAPVIPGIGRYIRRGYGTGDVAAEKLPLIGQSRTRMAVSVTEPPEQNDVGPPAVIEEGGSVFTVTVIALDVLGPQALATTQV
jgi:hypothetical protein